MGLVEFLRARLDEDERMASENRRNGYLGDGFDDYRIHATEETDRAGEFVLRFGPARMLAEVEAKRRIVDEHFGFLHPGGNPDRACRRCSDLRADDDPLIRMDRWIKLQPAPCTTLRLMTLPYADHPDYDPAWRP